MSRVSPPPLQALRDSTTFLPVIFLKYSRHHMFTFYYTLLRKKTYRLTAIFFAMSRRMWSLMSLQSCPLHPFLAERFRNLPSRQFRTYSRSRRFTLFFAIMTKKTYRLTAIFFAVSRGSVEGNHPPPPPPSCDLITTTNKHTIM